jgi:streptomycin 6-kinase
MLRLRNLFNCDARLSADLLEVDRERVRLWTFARAAAEPRDDWTDAGRMAIAKATAP